MTAIVSVNVCLSLCDWPPPPSWFEGVPRPLIEDSWKRLRPARDPPQETPTRKWRDGGTLSKYSISFTTDFFGCRKVSHCGSHPVLVACSPAIIFICPHSGLIVCSVGPLMSIPQHPPLFLFFFGAALLSSDGIQNGGQYR